MKVLLPLIAMLSAPALAELEIRNTVESQLSVLHNKNQRNRSDVQAFDNVLRTELETTFNEGLRLFAEVATRYEPKDILEPGKPSQHSASKLNRRWLLSDEAELELRELYIDGYVDTIFFRLGKQQIVWGQADGLQVLDVVNPMRYREFISDDLEQRRIPLWTSNIEIPIREWMLQLVWIPDQTYHLFPEVGSEYAVSSAKLTPTIEGTTQVVFAEASKPDRMVKDSDYGFRFTGFVNGWDIGLSYLNQYNNTPGVAQQKQDYIHTISTEFVRTHIVGGSFAKAFGNLSVRGELGYLSDALPLRNPSMEARTPASNAVRELKAVVGLDYNGISDTFLSMQLFTSRVLDRHQNLVRDDTEQQLSFLVKRDMRNQVLSVESLLVHSLNDRDGYWQLYAHYKFRSNILLNIGFDTYYGDELGVFGQFKTTNRTSIGVAFAF